MEIMALAALFGFCSAFIGLLIGGISAFGTKNHGRRFQGVLMGFTGGILIAFVCFELLPEAFGENRFYSVIAGMLCGVLLTAYLEGKIGRLCEKQKKHNNKLEKAGWLLSIGVLIHNIPEGMAIGALLSVSILEGIRLCIIIALHCIPEGLALSVAMGKKENGLMATLFSFVVLSASMGIGSFFGAVLSNFSETFIAVMFAFSGGVMLYITCGEIIPESKEVWNGRLTTIGSLMGFLLGVAVISSL